MLETSSAAGTEEGGAEDAAAWVTEWEEAAAEEVAAGRDSFLALEEDCCFCELSGVKTGFELEFELLEIEFVSELLELSELVAELSDEVAELDSAVLVTEEGLLLEELSSTVLETGVQPAAKMQTKAIAVVKIAFILVWLVNFKRFSPFTAAK